jgi:glycosyltransferase involved in cell wall biosynthesis
MNENPPVRNYSDLPRCVVVIPAHNEEEDIGQVIRDLKSRSNFPVVVIDDASTDRTRESAMENGATVIPLAVQLGAWGATQTGLRYAQRNGFEYAITMDADGQHQSES